MYRLYVDEVGTDGVTHTEKEKNQFLSLSGVAVDLGHIAQTVEPNLNWIKREVLRHDPDDPVILHRTDILGLKGPFQCLRLEGIRERFDKSLLRWLESSQFTLITALIDKQAMLKKKDKWKNKHPYHYLMEIMIEKYTLFLESKSSFGDVMPESRGKDKDSDLQLAFLKGIIPFLNTKTQGSFFVGKDRMNHRIKSNCLKFRSKKDNIAGLQLCDCVAHPSHMIITEQRGHIVNLGPFCLKIKQILNDSKYNRSPQGVISGYGTKYLP